MPTSCPRSSTLSTTSPSAAPSSQPLSLLLRGFQILAKPDDLTAVLRYTAVCNPYLYKENNAAQNVPWRVLTFMVPVIILSVIINIPRFFETVIVSETVNITTADNKTVEEEKVYYEVTPLRMDVDYIRSLVICFFALIY